jgi:hypothetical protein
MVCSVFIAIYLKKVKIFGACTCLVQALIVYVSLIYLYCYYYLFNYRSHSLLTLIIFQLFITELRSSLFVNHYIFHS